MTTSPREGPLPCNLAGEHLAGGTVNLLNRVEQLFKQLVLMLQGVPEKVEDCDQEKGREVMVVVAVVVGGVHD